MKRRKALRRLNKMRRAGIKAWKKKRPCKWQLACILLLVSLFCMSSFRKQDNWQEICITEETFIKKEWIQEQHKLEKTGNPTSAVLNEGAALFLKEGKLLFFRIREEEKTQKSTDQNEVDSFISNFNEHFACIH